MPDGRTRRRALIAFFLSGLLPGLGQLYNRQPVHGAAFLLVGGVLIWLVGRAVPTDLLGLASPEPALLVPLLVLVIIWVWSVIAAWTVARRRSE